MQCEMLLQSYHNVRMLKQHSLEYNLLSSLVIVTGCNPYVSKSGHLDTGHVKFLQVVHHRMTN